MITNSTERVKHVHCNHNRGITEVWDVVTSECAKGRRNVITLPMTVKNSVAMWNAIVTEK